jgi:branched-chain amino acid aminotransferase
MDFLAERFLKQFCPERKPLVPLDGVMFGNYTIAALPQQIAWLKHGCQQVLWLYGPNDLITEVGAMNIIGIWVNKASEKEMITARLDDGLILPGVTRASVLFLAREEDQLKVVEGAWTMAELIEAIEEKRLIEIFGCGTAAVVAPVNRILFKDKWYEVPMNPDDPAAPIGIYAERLLTKLRDI